MPVCETKRDLEFKKVIFLGMVNINQSENDSENANVRKA